jgi:hypothetical protein
LITRLDTASLNEVFDGSVKAEVKDEDLSTDLMDDIQDISQDIPRRVKQEDIKQEEIQTLDPSAQQINLQDGKAWAKLMNLLMQLRKVCDQYMPVLSRLTKVLIYCQIQSLNHTLSANISFLARESISFSINFCRNSLRKATVFCFSQDLPRTP